MGKAHSKEWKKGYIEALMDVKDRVMDVADWLYDLINAAKGLSEDDEEDE